MAQPPDIPDDILHIICDQLGAQNEFDSLYRCALAGLRFCDPALKTLYRLHDRTALVSGQDDLELMRQWRKTGQPTTFASQAAEREVIASKWALLWRSIIRSSLGKTFRPYCNYIRALNLRDLESLFDDTRFRGNIEKTFFADDLAKFNIRKDNPYFKKPTKTLHIVQALTAIGEAITAKAYLLEELGAHTVNAEQLPRWIQNLPRLETLVIWSGEALSHEAGSTIRKKCPNFCALTIFDWNNSDADERFEGFLKELAPNTLGYFETISASQIAGKAFSALSTHHCSSLLELKLSALSELALKSLDKLSSCRALRTLSLQDPRGTLRLEETQNDVFLSLVKWLLSCRHLTSLELKNLYDGPWLISSVLESPTSSGRLTRSPPLTKLNVEGYQMSHPSAANFHASLPSLSSTLISLSLRADGEEATPEDLDLLVSSITQLPSLRDLYLKDLSDNFTNQHISTLATSLPNLAEFWTSGTEITDEVFFSLINLRHLKTLFMYAMTQFTYDGIMGFISNLSSEPAQTFATDPEAETHDVKSAITDGNKGFWFSIMNAEAEYPLTEHQQSQIRIAIDERVGGRFDFTLHRGTWIHEHDDVVMLVE